MANLGFFLETLLGGLMAGMLYSLVALGFVLIFKASGVFNFAQGAMVLFAALAMARFAEWIPQWTGLDNKVLANLVAFVLAGAVMFVVAWVIERLVLRNLVNQEGATLLMATLGISYFLDGLGQTIFGNAGINVAKQLYFTGNDGTIILLHQQHHFIHLCIIKMYGIFNLHLFLNYRHHL